jgi:hypothetical protein
MYSSFINFRNAWQHTYRSVVSQLNSGDTCIDFKFSGKIELSIDLFTRMFIGFDIDGCANFKIFYVETRDIHTVFGSPILPCLYAEIRVNLKIANDPKEASEIFNNFFPSTKIRIFFSAKSTDERHISAEHLKYGGRKLLEYLTVWVNWIFENFQIPKILKSGIACPILKKRNLHMILGFTSIHKCHV